VNEDPEKAYGDALWELLLTGRVELPDGTTIDYADEDEP